MTTALWLLAIQGAMGAFDTLYYHEWRARLPAAGPLLAERTGPFKLLFRLSVEGGALAYRSEGAALSAGRLRVRLPRLLAPRVEAWERADEGGRGVRVRVRVTAPLVGLLVEYEGLVRKVETGGDAG